MGQVSLKIPPIPENFPCPNRLNWIEEELAQLKEAGLYNRIRTISSPQGAISGGGWKAGAEFLLQ